MPNKIESFHGDYRFLSNFWLCPVEYNDMIYPSSEHAFQATKASNQKDHDFVASAQTPGVAKRRGKQLKLQNRLRADWTQVSLSVMATVLRAKFRNADLRTLLLETGDAELVEGNTWGDTFWGVCDGKGENWLGILLMALRDRIREEVEKGDYAK